MKMRALKSFASREVAASLGQEFSCSEILAADLIRAKFAEPIAEPAKKEPAQEPAPEVKEVKEGKPEKKEAADESKRVDNKGNKPAAKGKRSRTK